MNINYRGTTYICRTEEELLRACSMIEEEEAQREAIARGQLVWDEADEPINRRTERWVKQRTFHPAERRLQAS